MNVFSSTRLPSLALKLVKSGLSAPNVHNVCLPVCSVVRVSFPANVNPNTIQVRNFSQSQGRVLYQADGMAAKIQQDLKNNRDRDGSDQNNFEVKKDDKGRLVVYEGALKTQIRGVKLFSLSTSLMGLSLQPILLAKTAESGLFAKIALFGTVGFFTFVTPLLIQALAKRYVTEFLYAPETDTYTAVTFNFIGLKKETEFKIEDVVVPDVPGPFTNFFVHLKNTNGSVKKIPLFVAPNCFVDLSHYGRIMGYDKPIDLRLNDEVNDVIKQKQDKDNKST